MKYIIIHSEWLDKNTFIIDFSPIPTTENFELKGVNEQVIVEYHKDENKWVVDKQYYDAEGGYIDHDLKAFTEYEKAQFLTIALRHYKDANSGRAWEEIVVADEYEKYDAFVDSIKNYYAEDDDELSNEIEDIIHARIIELFNELDKKYKN